MPRLHKQVWVFRAPLLCYGGIISGLYLQQSAWVSILSYHIAMCIGVTGLRGWSKAATLLRGWNRRAGATMIALYVLSGALIYILWPWIKLDGVNLEEILRDLGLQGFWWWGFFIYYSFVNPWLEELFWRGVYPENLKTDFISDLLFAGYHVFVLIIFVQTIWAILSLAVFVCTSWIWRCIAHRCRGLAIPVASHMAADVSVITAVALLTAS